MICCAVFIENQFYQPLFMYSMYDGNTTNILPVKSNSTMC